MLRLDRLALPFLVLLGMQELRIDVRRERLVRAAVRGREGAEADDLARQLGSWRVGGVRPAQAVGLEHPPRAPDKHPLVELHALVVVLPVERCDMCPGAPEAQGIEVAGADAGTLGSSTRSVPLCLLVRNTLDF